MVTATLRSEGAGESFLPSVFDNRKNLVLILYVHLLMKMTKLGIFKITNRNDATITMKKLW